MTPRARDALLLGATALLLLVGGQAAAAEAASLLTSRSSSIAQGAGWMLLGIELVLVLFAATLLLAARAPRPRDPSPLAAGRLPPVDILVPVRNEDPAVLAETLAAVARIRRGPQPGRVLVIDDSQDASHRQILAEVARAHGADHVTRPHRQGYKAGALNHALRATRAPYVAVLDVDHAPEPQFLENALSGLVADERVACVQTRIAWRNADAGIRRLAAILQDQFYGVIQWDRARRGRAVFAGSAAVFRRTALERVGGFPESTLVEDFDLTLQLQTAGWRMAYDDRVGARGLLPWTGRDVARQLWRWSHGTTRILRLRAARVLRAPIPLGHRVELLASAAAYVAGGMFVLAGVLLALRALVGAPPEGAEGAWIPLAALTPLAIFAAHAWTAAIATDRAGHRDWRIILPYHLVTLAFTPVLTASSLAALAGTESRSEGRVAKARHEATSTGHAAIGGFAVLTALGGLLLTAAAIQHLRDGSADAAWALELGLSFALPILVWGHTGTSRVNNAGARGGGAASLETD